MTIVVEPDAPAVAAAAADEFASHLAHAIALRGAALVCLTGGDTARTLYELIADAHRPWRARIDWTRVHLFWGDERHVPPDHPDSNFGMTRRALVDRVPIPGDHVHRMRAEWPDAAEVARDYDAALGRGFAAAGRADTTFDLMLLGLGADAHIGSIFPGSPLLAPGAAGDGPRAAAVRAEHLNAWRITLTPRGLLDAHAILLAVSGAAKADAVQAALDRPLDVIRWPAQLLREANDRLTWVMDAAAAARSPGAPRG